MKDFIYINTFFNMIYGNESAYIRDIQSYQFIKEFINWLDIYHISMPVLSSLQEIDLNMIASCRRITDVDHILHKPLSKEIKEISDTYQEKTHILYIPGLNNEPIIDIPFQKLKDTYFYQIQQPFSKQDLSFYDPFFSFVCAMNHADLWPGVLIFNQHQRVFTSISDQNDLKELINHIHYQDNLFEVYASYQEDSYFLQLSDLHLGKNKRQKGLEQLYSSLDTLIPYLYSPYPLKVFITGDLMESPNRKNMYLANDFMNSLKKKYKANVTFILGHHDVIVHGFNMARNQKSKVIAYLLGENIKVIENEKIIIVKMDTTSEGNLARGKVGLRQLQEIDDELEAIDHIEDYTILVMLHHHVYPISKAQFIKTTWHEKTFINQIIETSKVLVDAPLLIHWLEKRNIRYIFHGHKHLPFFRKVNDKYYIAGGSATGGLKESRSRYISYNLMKYNFIQKQMRTCLIFYDDKAKAERQRVELYIFEEDKV